MKYSLKDKQFKKRNHIFGQRKSHSPQNHDVAELNQIKELPFQSQESIYQLSDNHKYIDYSIVGNSKSSQNIKIQTKNANKLDNQLLSSSKHGLFPNTKPILPIPIITMLPIQRSSSTHNHHNHPNPNPTNTTINQPKPKNLSIESNINQFTYQRTNNHKAIIQTLKQYIMKLYKIVLTNNQKIQVLESTIQGLGNQCRSMMKFMGPAIRQVLGLEMKIDLFINTMRNVYEEMRISRLKQQNLELYFRQTKESISNNQNVKGNMARSFNKKPELNDFLKLLEYESEKQSVEGQKGFGQQIESRVRNLSHGYHIQNHNKRTQQQLTNNYNINKRNQQKAVSTFRQYDQPNKPIYSNHSIHQQRIINTNQNPWPYRTQNHHQNQQKLLSPFQAISIVRSRQPATSNHHHQTTYLQPQWPSHSKSHSKQIEKTVVYNDRHDRNVDYNRIKRSLQRKGYVGLVCWLDEMGCLRRANSTYVFDENGEVLLANKKIFDSLVDNGYIRQAS